MTFIILDTYNTMEQLAVIIKHMYAFGQEKMAMEILAISGHPLKEQLYLQAKTPTPQAELILSLGCFLQRTSDLGKTTVIKKEFDRLLLFAYPLYVILTLEI